MKRTLILLVLGAVSLVALACGDDDTEPTTTPPPGTGTPTGEPTHEPTDTPTESPTPEPQEGEAPDGLYGHGKRTGVAEIDAILEAWEKGDIDALTARVLLQEKECVEVLEGSGGPPKCPEGIPGGTPIQVFPASQCEGYWATEDSLRTLFQSFVDGADGQEYYLLAAWHEDGTEYWPAGLRIQFARTMDEYDVFSPQLVLNEDGRIFMYRGGCGPATIPPGVDMVLEPKA